MSPGWYQVWLDIARSVWPANMAQIALRLMPVAPVAIVKADQPRGAGAAIAHHYGASVVWNCFSHGTPPQHEEF